MPRGHEDWGVSSTAEKAAPDLPGAELAARLGALSLYDQTGQLIFADGLEQGFAPWVTDAQGTGASVTLIAGKSFLGGYCARLTGGSDGTRSAALVKDLPRPFLTRWGLETRAILDAAGGELSVAFRRYDGTQRHRFDVRVDLASGNLTILQADGTYATVQAAVSFNPGSYIWHPVKLVVDLAADAYVRLGFSTFSFDLSAYAPHLTPDTSRAFIAGDVTMISRAGQNDAMDVDSVIVTYNEP